ncbi:hypothetical protein IWX49DRAFT_44473 [Phyllosticta citricarpa]
MNDRPFRTQLPARFCAEALSLSLSAALPKSQKCGSTKRFGGCRKHRLFFAFNLFCGRPLVASVTASPENHPKPPSSSKQKAVEKAKRLAVTCNNLVCAASSQQHRVTSSILFGTTATRKCAISYPFLSEDSRSADLSASPKLRCDFNLVNHPRAAEEPKVSQATRPARIRTRKPLVMFTNLYLCRWPSLRLIISVPSAAILCC